MKFANNNEKKHHNRDGTDRNQEYRNQLPEDVARKNVHISSTKRPRGRRESRFSESLR